MIFSPEADLIRNLVNMHSPRCFKENKYHLALARGLQKENGVTRPERK